MNDDMNLNDSRNKLKIRLADFEEKEKHLPATRVRIIRKPISKDLHIPHTDSRIWRIDRKGGTVKKTLPSTLKLDLPDINFKNYYVVEEDSIKLEEEAVNNIYTETIIKDVETKTTINQHFQTVKKSVRIRMSRSKNIPSKLKQTLNKHSTNPSELEKFKTGINNGNVSIPSNKTSKENDIKNEPIERVKNSRNVKRKSKDPAELSDHQTLNIKKRSSSLEKVYEKMQNFLTPKKNTKNSDSLKNKIDEDINNNIQNENPLKRDVTNQVKKCKYSENFEREKKKNYERKNSTEQSNNQNGKQKKRNNSIERACNKIQSFLTPKKNLKNSDCLKREVDKEIVESIKNESPSQRDVTNQVKKRRFCDRLTKENLILLRKSLDIQIN